MAITPEDASYNWKQAVKVLQAAIQLESTREAREEIYLGQIAVNSIAMLDELAKIRTILEARR